MHIGNNTNSVSNLQQTLGNQASVTSETKKPIYVKVGFGLIGLTTDKKLASTSKEVYKFVKEKLHALDNNALQKFAGIKPNCVLTKRESVVLSVAKHIPVISKISAGLIGLTKNVSSKDVQTSYYTDITATTVVSELLKRKHDEQKEIVSQVSDLVAQIKVLESQKDEHMVEKKMMRGKFDPETQTVGTVVVQAPGGDKIDKINKDIEQLSNQIQEKTQPIRKELAELKKLINQNPKDSPAISSAKKAFVKENQEFVNTLNSLTLVDHSETAELKIQHSVEDSEIIPLQTNFSSEINFNEKAQASERTEGSSARAEVKEYYSNKGEEAPDFSLASNYMTFEKLETVENPSGEHLCNAFKSGLSEADGQEILKSNKIGKEAISYITSQLDEIVMSGDIKTIKTADELKNELKNRVSKNRVKEEEIDRETFADLIDAKLGKPPPNDLLNAPEYKKAKMSFNDGSWIANEEKNFHFTQFEEEKLGVVNKLIDKMFEVEVVQKTINTLIEKSS